VHLMEIAGDLWTGRRGAGGRGSRRVRPAGRRGSEGSFCLRFGLVGNCVVAQVLLIGAVGLMMHGPRNLVSPNENIFELLWGWQWLSFCSFIPLWVFSFFLSMCRLNKDKIWCMPPRARCFHFFNLFSEFFSFSLDLKLKRIQGGRLVRANSPLQPL